MQFDPRTSGVALGELQCSSGRRTAKELYFLSGVPVTWVAALAERYTYQQRSKACCRDAHDAGVMAFNGWQVYS
jgi:hypothetical protein